MSRKTQQQRSLRGSSRIVVSVLLKIGSVLLYCGFNKVRETEGILSSPIPIYPVYSTSAKEEKKDPERAVFPLLQQQIIFSVCKGWGSVWFLLWVQKQRERLKCVTFAYPSSILSPITSANKARKIQTQYCKAQ